MLCQWIKMNDGRLWCPVCDPDKKRTQRQNTRRHCGPMPAYPEPPPAPVDAAAWFTAYYAAQNLTSPPLADILARLERCRSADCVGLQNDVCTAMGSSPCKQRAVWFSMLTGTASCQHWLPV